MRKKTNGKRMQRKHIDWEKTLQSAVICMAFVVLFFLCVKKIDASSFLLQETLPGLTIASAQENPLPAAGGTQAAADAPAGTPDAQGDAKTDRTGLIEDNPHFMPVGDVIGTNDIQFQPETDPSGIVLENPVSFADINMDDLRDLDYLSTSFYTVDKRTGISAQDFNADRFMQTDLKIDTAGDDPKILIFHTHSCEMYSDSNPDDPMDGVMGVGEKLAEILTNVYGIKTMHHTGRYDLQGIMGAYERMEPPVMDILRANPSIEVAIDIHRDGVVNASRRFVTTQNGEQMAQVMFFNGLCKQKKGGALEPYSLTNPYLDTNLAFSFRAELTAKELFPGFTRNPYLNAYRYSLNMLPKSMLVEVGAQTNTKEEAFNAMGPLAEILANVLLN